MHVGADDVDTVFVGEGRVGAFPGRDAAAAAAQCDGRLLYPGGPEAVEEVRLAGHFSVLEVRVSKLTDIDLFSVRNL